MVIFFQGENIGDAAIREVFEETGVKTEFVSLVAFRHVLNSSFDCADMYFVTNLRPLTSDIVIDKEILDAKWMKVISNCFIRSTGIRITLF